MLAASTVPDVQGAALIAGLEHGLHVVADKPLVSHTRATGAGEDGPQATSRPAAVHAAHPPRRSRCVARPAAWSGQALSGKLWHSTADAPTSKSGSRRAGVGCSMNGGPAGRWATPPCIASMRCAGLPRLRYLEVVGYEANHSRPENGHFYDASQHLYWLESGVTAMIDTHLLAIADSWLSILGTQGQDRNCGEQSGRADYGGRHDRDRDDGTGDQRVCGLGREHRGRPAGYRRHRRCPSLAWMPSLPDRLRRRADGLFPSPPSPPTGLDRGLRRNE